MRNHHKRNFNYNANYFLYLHIFYHFAIRHERHYYFRVVLTHRLISYALSFRLDSRAASP